MDWQLIFKIVYYVILLVFTFKVIYDTESSTKASAYILLIFLLPVAGILIYLSFGLNYRKSQIYDKKLQLDQNQKKIINQYIEFYLKDTKKEFDEKFSKYFGLGNMLYSDTESFVTKNNQVNLLINGENKFPAMFDALRKAKHHIHIEYYIYDDDEIGNELAEILMQKAREGVQVRFIYDDFGSRKIRKHLVPKLRESGVEAYAFYKVQFIYLANRLNYRNHRKIVIVDDSVGFVGGINVSDKYVNRNPEDLYWRDTHLMLEGDSVNELQRIFLADWNFCSNQNVKPNPSFFKQHPILENPQWVQIIPSGPDSMNPSILYSFLHAIAISEKEILITTPYLIPGEEFLHALHMAVLRGVRVKVLVPEFSDSLVVNAVSKSYYLDLLDQGVEIYLYQKGFVHAKTMVCDDELSIIGTANLDNRSFDLNFEVNAMVYDRDITSQLRQTFNNDLENSRQIYYEDWANRKKYKQFLEKCLRLISPLM
ncbi:cardiolipin synthase [Flavobacteriaceae bacterium Ap0902]|nr:cardiolipin synthase [Flavobacteriaceae bacterium Ap0902]